ncbi:hypothetical protein ES705_28972 [subsurface metagenome]
MKQRPDDIVLVEGDNDLNVQMVPIALVGWILPTGHIDPSGRWYNPEDAYDGNINTDANPSSSYYNQPLELTLDSPIYCNKVKICADSYGREHFDYCAANVKVEVYYDGAYHTIHSGLLGPDYDGYPARKLWVELLIPAGTKLVSKARIRWNVLYVGIYFWEFAFWSEG